MKKVKKLVLSKETLRALESDRLSKVLGQASTDVICGPSEFSYCGPCVDTGPAYR